MKIFSSFLLCASMAFGQSQAIRPAPVKGPTNLEGAIVNAKVNLVWAACDNAQTYQVYRTKTKGGPYIKIKDSLPLIRFTDTPGSGTFYYVTSCSNNRGTSAYSNELAVEVKP